MGYTQSGVVDGQSPRSNGKLTEKRSRWLNDLGVADGEWYMNPMARPRRLMEISLSSEAIRVYACLEIHTMGFQQEEAVISIPDESRDGVVISWKTRYLTTCDIARKCQMKESNVRRALRELESHGLVKRQSIDGSGLHQGNIVILSWAKPRNPVSNGKEGEKRSRAISFLGDEFTPLKTLINRLKLNIPQELADIKPEDIPEHSRDLFSRALEIARKIEDLEKEGRQIAESGLREMAHHYSLSRSYSETVSQSEAENSAAEEPLTEDRQTDHPPPEPDPEPPPDPLDALMAQMAQKIRRPDPENPGGKLPVEEPGPTLRLQIRAQLDRTPLYRLEYLAKQRMKPGDSLGLLVKLAEQANRTFNQEQSQITQAEQAAEAKRIEGWKAIANDPDESDEIREQCREILRARGIELIE